MMASLFCRLGGAFALLCGACGAGRAQTCLPLAGQWVLDAGRSHMAAGLSFNPYFRVDAIGLTMSREAGGALQQDWQFDGPHIHEAVGYAFAVDGHAQATHARSKLDSVPAEITPAWQNCTLIVDARSVLFGTDVWTHNVYVLEAAGRRLTILQTGRSGIGHTERALVFDRAGATP